MSEHAGLDRALRRRDLAGVLLNAMVGAGMLAAPARVYGLAGDWSFVVLAASGAILLPMILCFAELGSRFSDTGGPTLYARAALPAWTAFLAGWLLWISQALGVATLSNLLISYLGGVWPALQDGLPRAGLIVAMALVLTGVVLTGIRQTAATSNGLIVVKLVFVIGFLAAGLAWIQPHRLAPMSAAPAAIPFAQAVMIYLFAASGFERGTVLAGEARDPRRDVPASLLMGLVTAFVAYGAVLAVCVGVLGDPSATDRPLAEAGRVMLGPLGQALATAGAGVVIVGTLVSLLAAMPRVLVGLAQQGQLPAIFGTVHPRWRTPHWAIVTSSLVGFAAALGSELIAALTFSTAARLSVYLISCVALWRLSRRANAPQPAFKLPAVGVLSLATIAIFTGVMAFGAQKELPLLVAVIAAGLGLMLLAGRRRALAPDPRSTT